MIGSYWKGKYREFGPHLLCWVNLGWRVCMDKTVQAAGDTVSHADGMELIVVNTTG